jgi:hypothetical protein
MSAIFLSRARLSFFLSRNSLTHHSLQQIRKCLQEWDLLSSPSSPANPEPELDVHSALTPVNTEVQLDTHSTSDGWENIHSKSHSRTRLSSSPTLPFLPDSPTYTPSPVTADFDPENIHLYKERPLPFIPTTSQHKRKSSTSLDRPAKDKLKLTCHHGPESHEVEMTLGILGHQGPSPIETYASDDQSHERIAVGLERNPGPDIPESDNTDLTLSWKKSGQRARSGAANRTERALKQRSRKHEKKGSEGH